MPISIATLKALVAAGATAEMILAAVEAQQAEEIDRVEERRRNDRERKRNSKDFRGKRKLPRKDTENAEAKPKLDANDGLQAQTLGSEATTSPVNKSHAPEQKEKSSPVPPPKEKSLPRVVRARAREATRLPDDWQPTDNDLAFARSVLPSQLVEHEVGKFRDYWHARPKDATKLDWSATFRIWIRRAVDGLSRGPPGDRTSQPRFAPNQLKNNGGQIVENTSNASSDWRRRRDARQAAYAEFHDNVVAERKDREGTCEGDGRPPVRVVPDA